MAVVNKFNVNNKQVTLDPDIIENMSANDVSYNASTQYDENTVGDKLLELESKVSNDIGIGNKLSFIGDGNTLIGSNGENPLYGVSPGEKYRVFIVNPNVDMTGVTSSAQSSRFAIWSMDSNSNPKLLMSILMDQSLDDYYDITIPTDGVSIFISGRCAVGAILKTCVQKITNESSELLVDFLRGDEITSWENGYYIPTLNVDQTIDLNNKVEHMEFKTTVVDCSPGDLFEINNHQGGGTARAWAFIDSNNVVLSISNTGEFINKIITTPMNAVKVVFNNNKNFTGNWLKYYYVLNNQINPQYLESFATKKYVENAIGDVKENVVDLIMFMGQSNMAGRGETNEQHTEGFPTIIDNAGYEYRAISDPSKLYQIVEPFGVNENKSGGINDGLNKTGSSVVAFVNSYYEQSGVSVVAVSASKGGTTIAEWQPSGILLPDAIQRFEAAVQFLTENNYTICRKYMVWLQGESDGDDGTSKENYISLFNTMFAAMKNVGIEKCLLIRIGKRSHDEAYSPIIDAQTEICEQSEDIIMISTALSDFRRLGYMKDNYHYFQDGYNRIGRISGHNAGVFARYGIERMQFDSENVNNIYLSYKCN